MSRTGSTRWSPTPEQVMILEQLYRSGIRTPTASQIQHITTHLCFYGRIEGKNVFYWFQNHKARDRQKLRRKLNKQLQLQQQQQNMLVQHQRQVVDHQDNIHHHFWSFGRGFDSSASHGFHGSSAQQVSLYNTSSLLSHQGETGENSSETRKKSEKKQESVVELDKTKTSSIFCNYGTMSCCHWSFEDVNEESSYCCTTSRPLKTLDLFPITSTKLKEDNFNLTL